MISIRLDYIEFIINCIIHDLGEDQDEEEKVAAEEKEKPKSDFKSHLNGLYNGLAKIMSTTCNLEAETKPAAPFAIEKAVHNIMFIKHHMKRQDEFDAVRILIKAIAVY